MEGRRQLEDPRPQCSLDMGVRQCMMNCQHCGWDKYEIVRRKMIPPTRDEQTKLYRKLV